MRKIAIYILAAASLCLASCISLEDGFNPVQEGKKLTVMASVADFNSLNVNTKALEEEESRVNELTMLIFDSGNAIVGRPVNLSGGSSVFMIDTQNALIIDGKNQQIPMKNDQAMLDACSIYMVANCWHKLEGMTINTVSDLLAVDILVEAIDIPANGIPMIGVQSGFDLSKDRPEAASTVADIVMDKLYAKVNVRFQVNADQVINTPLFNLKGWTVSNIPAAVRLGEPAEGAETENATGEVLATTSPSSVLSYGRPTIYHSESVANPDYFQFTFYVPEHRVNPKGSVTYPTGLPETEKQRYKPLLCTGTQKPMYVTVEGSYTDHHGQVKEVTYSLYLGQDNTSNFHIKRNQELNNIITIKGLTNSKDAIDWVPDGGQDNISVDHRVEISDTGFSIAIEREALLDSHFEVRPMDVFVNEGGKVVVTVDDASNTDPNKTVWLRIEKSDPALEEHHIKGKGVRKYFTEKLVTETLVNSKEIEVLSNSRIWLYFDDNSENVYDKTLDTDPQNPLPKSREIKLVVKYYENASDSQPKVTQNYTFQQMHLWRVRNANNTRYYDIEYHEEYLYNYASDDNYGKTTDGMAWGLDGLQLSDTDIAFVMKSKFNLDFITQYFTNNSAASTFKYDFYISADESNCVDYMDSDNDNNTSEKVYHEYNGLNFTKKIIAKAMNTRDSNNTPYLSSKRLLNESPESAIEYCYNKNKRNTDGTVKETEWFLPAIDEIEDIVENAYTDFEVFQNKFYWSSQPAFIVKNWNAKFWVIITTLDYNGTLYIDNVNYARATKVNYVANQFKAAESAMHNPNETLNLGYIPNSNTPTPSIDNSITPTYDEGYRPRVNEKESINRIRCVRNSGPVSELTNSTN